MQADGGGDEWSWIDRTTGVGRNGVVQAGRGGQDSDGSDVLQRQRSGVDHARPAGKTDVDDASGRLNQLKGQRRQVRGVGGVNYRIEGKVREGVLGPGVRET